MPINDLRSMTDPELMRHLEKLEGSLQDLKLKNSIGNLDNPNKIKAIRKDIARVKTILRERAF